MPDKARYATAHWLRFADVMTAGALPLSCSCPCVTAANAIISIARRPVSSSRSPRPIRADR